MSMFLLDCVDFKRYLSHILSTIERGGVRVCNVLVILFLIYLN